MSVDNGCDGNLGVLWFDPAGTNRALHRIRQHPVGLAKNLKGSGRRPDRHLAQRQLVASVLHGRVRA